MGDILHIILAALMGLLLGFVGERWRAQFIEHRGQRDYLRFVKSRLLAIQSLCTRIERFEQAGDAFIAILSLQEHYDELAGARQQGSLVVDPDFTRRLSDLRNILRLLSDHLRLASTDPSARLSPAQLSQLFEFMPRLRTAAELLEAEADRVAEVLGLSIRL